MSAGWEVGDLALCVRVGIIVVNGRKGDGRGLEQGAAYRVLGVSTHPLVKMQVLFVENSQSDEGYAASRFLKIRPDKHEDCEPEFITLMNRIKRLTPKEVRA